LKTGECVPLSLLVKAFLGFTQNSFEKWLFKRFCKNSGNVPTNRKKGNYSKENGACTPSFQKSVKIQKLLVLSA
jgi:hypothetical protein